MEQRTPYQSQRQAPCLPLFHRDASVCIRGGSIAIEYKTDNKGNVVKRKVVDCNNKKFKSATLEAFDKVKNIRINKLQQTDTIYFQYKIQGSLTPIHPLTDVEIIGYGSYDIPILMK